MKIVLGHEAINALFPEGSEARIELQRHVMQCFVQQHLKASAVTKEVRDLVDVAKRDAVKEAARELGIGSSWGSVTLSDDFKRKLRDLARDAHSEAAREAMREAANQAAESMRKDLEYMIRSRLEQTVQKELMAKVGEKLQAAMQSAVASAIKA